MPDETTLSPAAPAFASRADLLAPRAFRYGTMTLPQSGLTVRYRSLSDREYSDYQFWGKAEDSEGQGLDDSQALKQARVQLIVLCLIDEQGNRIFSEADVAGLAEAMDAADSAALFDRLRAHCGLDRRRNAEQAKKN